MAEKPLLLLDIDGVVNVFGAWGRTVRGMRAPDGLRVAQAGGFPLLLHPQHPAWIAELEDHFDVMWATMWQDNAVLFGRVAGFGQAWDYIDFDAYRGDWLERRRMTGNGVGSYKHPGIVATLAERAGVWIDDDMTPDQKRWAARRTQSGLPTLFLQPEPGTGMTREHVDAALALATGSECATIPA